MNLGGEAGFCRKAIRENVKRLASLSLIFQIVQRGTVGMKKWCILMGLS